MADIASQNHSAALDEARRKPSPVNNVEAAKNLAKAATPMGTFSALKQVDFLKDIPFFCAFGAAILKYILDLIFFETIILPILFSILCSIFIFMMMFLAGANKKMKSARGFLKGGFIISGGIFDAIPGLDFLPIEFVTVGIIYYMTLSERANAIE